MPAKARRYVARFMARTRLTGAEKSISICVTWFLELSTSLTPMTVTGDSTGAATVIETVPGLLVVVAGLVAGPVAWTTYWNESGPGVSSVGRVDERAAGSIEATDRAVDGLREELIGERRPAWSVFG